MSQKSARLLRAPGSFPAKIITSSSTSWPINSLQSNLIRTLCSHQSRRKIVTWNHQPCWSFLSVTKTPMRLERCNRFPFSAVTRPIAPIISRKSSIKSQARIIPNAPVTQNRASSDSGLQASIISTDNIDRRTIYELLKLSTFTNSEVHWRFDQIIHAGDRLDENVHGPYHNTDSTSFAGDEKTISTSTASIVDESTNNENNGAITDASSKQVSTRESMHIQDLEAYLYERYLHIDDQWNNRYTIVPSSTSTMDDASRANEDKESRLHRIRQCAKSDASSIFQLLLENVKDSPIINATTSSSPTLTKDQFQQSVQTLGAKVDYSTILPLATSMLLVGSSVGVTSPIMPFLAEKLDLTTTLYGVVVSSLALSKMLGNIPSAILVERHGRKPYLVHSLWAVGLGVAGMGLSTDWMQLSFCRMVIGLGVASLSTASTLTVADSSTPLSRARTFSPLMGAFAAGMAIGPAIGGILCDTWGIQNTFFAVSSSYLVASIWNHFGVNETKRQGELWERKALPWHSPEATEALVAFSQRADNVQTESVSIATAVKDTTEQWTKLLADTNVRPIVIMNGVYMSTLAATQLILFPLLITGGGTSAAGASAGLALSATAVGQLYMYMSLHQVVGNPIAGQFADRQGKSAAIIAGGVLTSLAVAIFPPVCALNVTGDNVLDWGNWPMLATLSLWSLGGTFSATAHVAAISDETKDSSRSQAIALLRTAGDVGYLCGATCAGISADLVGDVGLAMQASSAVFLGATGWFGLKSAAMNKARNR